MTEKVNKIARYIQLWQNYAFVISVTRHLDQHFLGVSSAISDDDAFLLLMTGFEEDCLLFISRVPYYILINKRGRCT